ncbi:VanZ family protein [Gottfriedia sp. NPDC057991]|uniref:VanZ family protein n=1 Tax=Gottfriedia sp. NPDC057991 TaxID=3346298 RepID=UPI0036DDDC18
MIKKGFLVIKEKLFKGIFYHYKNIRYYKQIFCILAKEKVIGLRLFIGEIVIVFVILCYLILRAIIFVLKMKNKKTFDWYKEIIGLLLVLYSLMVFSVTLFPLYITPHGNFQFPYWSINYIPLISIMRDINEVGIAYSGDTFFMIKLIVRNVGGNIVMFMPLGFLVPVIWKDCKRLKKILMIGLIVSLSIESLQFLENFFGVGLGRIIDIDDVICNVIGTIIGYLIYKLLILFLGKTKKVFSRSNHLDI